MAFHTILKSSKDYYEALRWARLLTDRLQETINKNLTEDQVHKKSVQEIKQHYSAVTGFCNRETKAFEEL